MRGSRSAFFFKTRNAQATKVRRHPRLRQINDNRFLTKLNDFRVSLFYSFAHRSNFTDVVLGLSKSLVDCDDIAFPCAQMKAGNLNYSRVGAS
jgi:hypothetical protein